MHTVSKVLRDVRTKGQADDGRSLQVYVERACFDDGFLAVFLAHMASAFKSISTVGRLLTPEEIQTIVRKGATPVTIVHIAANPANLVFVRQAVLSQIEKDPKDVAFQWTSARSDQERRVQEWEDLRARYEDAVVPRTARLAREER